jgi:hypothetical protein
MAEVELGHAIQVSFSVMAKVGLSHAVQVSFFFIALWAYCNCHAMVCCAGSNIVFTSPLCTLLTKQ